MLCINKVVTPVPLVMVYILLQIVTVVLIIATMVTFSDHNHSEYVLKSGFMMNKFTGME